MVWNGDASCHSPRTSFGIKAITCTVLVLLLQRSISVQGALNRVATSILAATTVEAEGLSDLTCIVFADLLRCSLLASSCCCGL